MGVRRGAAVKLLAVAYIQSCTCTCLNKKKFPNTYRDHAFEHRRDHTAVIGVREIMNGL